MTTYYEVKISAENQEQADTILTSLLGKKLVTGGQFIVAPARFWWKGKIENVRKMSAENFPMITFVAPNDLNQELRGWIDRTLA